jgi:vancomycin resistance protein YoaR
LRRAATAQLNRRVALPDAGSLVVDWRIVAPAVTAVFTLLVLIILTATLLNTFADRIPAGVRVLGVDVGGRTREEGQARLLAASGSYLARPVVLRAEGHEWELAASDLGVLIDVETMIDDAYEVAKQGNVFQRALTQWAALILGERLQQPKFLFDEPRMEAALMDMSKSIERPPHDARIAVIPGRDGGTVVITPEEFGLDVRIPESTQRARAALAHGLPARADLVVESAAPAALAADFQAAKAQAEQAMSAPVTLTFENKRWTVSREEIARTLTFERDAGQPARLAIDPEPLRPLLLRISQEVGQPAVNARFEWTGSVARPIREGQDGREVDTEAIKTELRERVLSDQRTVALTLASTRPDITSADGAKLGIKDLIKEGRTSFPGSVAEKQHNIRLAASRLNGVVVPPGGVFSFNREVGPTTLEAGFQSGWGITTSSSGARTIPSVAGGICQVATTLFHPVFHAGYTIEERHWHLYWIPSYGQPPLGMQGLDATVDEDARLDFKFINPTSDYLLVQARVEGTTLVFGLYGTKPDWTVKVDGPVITNVVPADREPVRQAEPTMPEGRTLAVESAHDGFTATITRVVTLGNDVRQLRLRSNYVPSRNVTLYGTGGT